MALEKGAEICLRSPVLSFPPRPVEPLSAGDREVVRDVGRISGMRRRFAIEALTCGLLIGVGPLTGAVAQSSQRTVAITQIVEHPDLDNVRRGVTDALAQEGFGPTTTKLVFESAQGDVATGVQIAKRFVGLAPDVIVAIGTPTAQAAVRSTTTIPIVFAGIGDPLGSGLVKSMDHPGGNVTGASAFTPVEPQLDLIKILVPNARRIGILSNPAEANSRAAVDAMVKAGTVRGYEFVRENVMASSEIYSAASNLVGKIDAFYVPTDSTVVSGVEAAVKVALANRIPMFTSETGGAKRGALAAAGFDWHQIGLDAGRIAVRVLRGEKPGDIPVKPATGLSVRLNARTARAIGIAFPSDLVARAAEVVE